MVEKSGLVSAGPSVEVKVCIINAEGVIQSCVDLKIGLSVRSFLLGHVESKVVYG